VVLLLKCEALWGICSTMQIDLDEAFKFEKFVKSFESVHDDFNSKMIREVFRVFHQAGLKQISFNGKSNTIIQILSGVRS